MREWGVRVEQYWEERQQLLESIGSNDSGEGLRTWAGRRCGTALCIPLCPPRFAPSGFGSLVLPKKRAEVSWTFERSGGESTHASRSRTLLTLLSSVPCLSVLVPILMSGRNESVEVRMARRVEVRAPVATRGCD